jgi:hypothetical protein
MDPSAFHIHPELLDPPVKRAAYSDRTAWLMAVMSQLAYLPFEGPPDAAEIRRIAARLVEHPRIEDVVHALNAIVAKPDQGAPARAQLELGLGALRLELIETFSVSIPFKTDSQAFIARVGAEWRDAERAGDDFLVLAFRGTEPAKLTDLKTDIRAGMKLASRQPDPKALVHSGFHDALMAAEPGREAIIDRINSVLRREAFRGLPVFITGHSLGGALAVLATRYVANGSRGACYTFGQPRVANQVFNAQIFTPVYRVVNAADAVPAVPFKHTAMNVVIAIVRFLPVPGTGPLERWLSRMRGYRHGGDLRFLTYAAAVPGDEGAPDFPKLKVFSNASLVDRWWRSVGRFIASWGTALLSDHDIGEYIDKLAYYAKTRTRTRKALNRSDSDSKPEVSSDKRAQDSPA